MNDRRSPRISLRKQPQQARSSELVAAVLTASVQVLAKEGAPRFTMARVAEKAGVSVGSLYQYFPNKAAILFRLQSDEWTQTSELLRALLTDRTRPPLERLRAVVHAFFCSEWEEEAVRTALGDAAPLYRDAPEARDARKAAESLFEEFMREALPRTPSHVRDAVANLVETTLSEVGRRCSQSCRTAAEVESQAERMADMLCAYLRTLASG